MHILREPLVHFLLLGAVVFGVFALVGERDRAQTGQIVVTPGHIEHLTVRFTRTWQRPPTAPELAGLADAYTERATLACAGGLEGRRMAIDGLTATLTDVLVRLVRTDGSTQSMRLVPSAPSFVVAALPSRFQVAATYLRLGSGLTSMGLPRAEIPTALLLFNLGVEASQMLFVWLMVLLTRAFHTLDIRWPHWVEAVPAYTVGTLGAYWTMQRTMLLLGGLR
jgi:hypothetical protein